MSTFDFTPLLATNLPPAAAAWSGYPEVNFVGGHNAKEAIPVEALIEGVTRRLRALGQDLATYHIGDGPQGYLPLHQTSRLYHWNHAGFSSSARRLPPQIPPLCLHIHVASRSGPSEIHRSIAVRGN